METRRIIVERLMQARISEAANERLLRAARNARRDGYRDNRPARAASVLGRLAGLAVQRGFGHAHV